jgi:hypothetical protein
MEIRSCRPNSCNTTRGTKETLHVTGMETGVVSGVAIFVNHQTNKMSKGAVVQTTVWLRIFVDPNSFIPTQTTKRAHLKSSPRHSSASHQSASNKTVQYP